MSDHTLPVAAPITALADRITITPGGLKAEIADETFEADNPTLVAQQLGDALYELTHAGHDKLTGTIRRTMREPDLDTALLEATGKRTTTITTRYITGDEHTATVAIDGIRVRLPADRLTTRTGETATVVLPCARPAVSTGFFLATSGKVPFRSTGQLLRLYGRIDTKDAAPTIWRQLVAFLEDSTIPWQAKISSSRVGYPRNDAVVVYLPRPAWRAARPCADMLQATGLMGEGSSTFTHQLTHSVACAFEPDDARPSYRGLSFGQHRTKVLAEALVKHATLPADEAGTVNDFIYGAYIDAGIDPSQPARNLSSPIVDVLPVA